MVNCIILNTKPKTLKINANIMELVSVLLIMYSTPYFSNTSKLYTLV